MGSAAFGAWGWPGMTALLCCWLAMAAFGVWLARHAAAERSPEAEEAQVASGS